MTYSLDSHPTDNYSSRESYGYGPSPVGFTIHWWGRAGQLHDNVVHYLAEVSTDSSAHEVISDGRVSHLIDFNLAAWHSGSDEGNGEWIGLECRPEMTDGDLETLAQRCADVEKQLGKSMYYNVHSDWVATTCPGTYREQIGWLVNRVNEIHNEPEGVLGMQLDEVVYNNVTVRDLLTDLHKREFPDIPPPVDPPPPVDLSPLYEKIDRNQQLLFYYNGQSTWDELSSTTWDSLSNKEWDSISA